MTRQFWVQIHRWAGLSMVAFLIIVAVTGSLLAFYPELERLINPQLYPKQVLENKLDIATLAELAQQRVPYGQVNAVLMEANEESTVISMNAQPDSSGQLSELGFDQLLVDTYTGEELGKRQFGAISEGMINYHALYLQNALQPSTGQFWYVDPWYLRIDLDARLFYRLLSDIAPKA